MENTCASNVGRQKLLSTKCFTPRRVNDRIGLRIHRGSQTALNRERRQYEDEHID